MKAIAFIKELYVRITLESPSFFKALAKFGASLVAIGLGLVLAVGNAPEGISDKVVHILKEIGEHLAFAGGIIVVIARSAVKDPEALEEKLNRNK